MKNFKHLIFIGLTFSLHVIAFSQNLKIFTANAVPSTPMPMVTDIEAIPEDNARVFSYYFLDNNNFLSCSIVKVDNNGNILFNKTISLPQNHIGCQEIKYINGIIYLLLEYRNTFANLNFKTVIAKMDKNDGNIISAELFDGYSSNQNFWAVDLSVNEFGVTSFLAVGCDGNPFLNPTNSKVYFMTRDAFFPSLTTKVYEYYDPTHSNAVFHPRNIVSSYQMISNNNYYFTHQFAGIYYKEGLNNLSQKKIFYASVNKPGPLPGYTIFTSSHKVGGVVPLEINVGFFDGMTFLWGQNACSVNCYGDFFYGELPYLTGNTSINTYNNSHFEFIPSKKGVNQAEYYQDPLDNYYFGFVGGYKPIDFVLPGYVQGFLKLPGNVLGVEMNRYNLKVDYDYNNNYSTFYFDVDLNHATIPGVARRAYADPRTFYFWHDKEPTCLLSMDFPEQSQNITTEVENGFVFNEVPLSVTPIILNVSDGSALTQDIICSDSFSEDDPIGSSDYNNLFIPHYPRFENSSDNRNSQKNYFVPQSDNKINFKGDNVLIYPNPTSNVCVITSNNELLNMIEIYDSKGLKILSFMNINSHKYIIDVKGWSKGLYFIKMITENNIKTEKVVVQ